MARAGALTKEGLAALGADRLADLLLELGAADPALRKRLVLASAEGGGAEALVKAIDRRLKALAESRGMIAWEKERTYATELDGLRAAISGGLARADVGAAADRLRRFIGLSGSVFGRVDDSSGRFGAVFAKAVEDWIRARLQARSDPPALARDVFALIDSDDYGVCDGLIAALAPALGSEGYDVLTALARESLAKQPAKADAHFDGRGYRMRGMLLEIADARGDVDAFIAVATSVSGSSGPDPLAIASRLLKAGRAEEALTWLDRQPVRAIGVGRTDRYGSISISYPAQVLADNLRIGALEALGRRVEAQAIRWKQFEATLSVPVLRAYIAALDDFEEFDAVDRAFAVAEAHADTARALGFFVGWNALARAAQFAENRLAKLNGAEYGVLEPAAEALSGAHPRTAVKLYRRMIDSVLERGVSSAYPHAVRNLEACAALADQVEGSGADLPSHPDYVGQLRARHGRKHGFWRLVQS